MDYLLLLPNIQDWWLHGAVAAIALACYYYLLLPMNWSRELCDVGFEPPGCAWRPWRASRRTREKELLQSRSTRRVGNLPPVYPNGWFPILESAELGRAEVRHVTALGQSLAVFRSDAGQAFIVDALCPHMGANMARGGRVKGDCIECPFHDWSFDGKDGKCASVPYASKVPEFARVQRWECMETNGWVFMWHHAEGEEPTWRPQPVPQVVEGTWSYVGRNEFFVSCHIQEIPENGADVAHLNAVHGPGMVGCGVSRHLWDAIWSPGPEQHTAQLRISHQLDFCGIVRLLKMNVQANQIGPGYVELYLESSLGPMIILQSVVPVGPLLQKVTHRMYSPPLLVLYAKIVLFGECVMFERDVKIWNHKQFEDKPLLVKEDRTISRFRRWYSQFYSENSPRHTFQKDTMEW